MLTAPRPTAPIGAASPIWPTTPVSTAPRMGTVALDSTIGMAMLSTLRWVSGVAGGALSAILARHQEMPRRLGNSAGSIVLPCLDLNACIPPPRTVDPRACIGVAWQAGTQVVHCKVYCFRQAGQFSGDEPVHVKRAAFDLFPQDRPAQPDDGCHLEKGRHGTAV